MEPRLEQPCFDAGLDHHHLLRRRAESCLSACCCSSDGEQSLACPGNRHGRDRVCGSENHFLGQEQHRSSIVPASASFQHCSNRPSIVPASFQHPCIFVPASLQQRSSMVPAWCQHRSSSFPASFQHGSSTVPASLQHRSSITAAKAIQRHSRRGQNKPAAKQARPNKAQQQNH